MYLPACPHACLPICLPLRGARAASRVKLDRAAGLAVHAGTSSTHAASLCRPCHLQNKHQRVCPRVRARARLSAWACMCCLSVIRTQTWVSLPAISLLLPDIPPCYHTSTGHFVNAKSCDTAYAAQTHSLPRVVGGTRPASQPASQSASQSQRRTVAANPPTTAQPPGPAKSHHLAPPSPPSHSRAPSPRTTQRARTDKRSLHTDNRLCRAA
ncbi:hypothetical protein LY76DRAFT_163771 [Colletotrichum caudatum]|nr:hypothetical protein LY76DRAFT_163771 [Colletotrichum caudatum]